MNAPTGKFTGIEEVDTGSLKFFQLRSEMLDCFADIERSLLAYVLKNDQKGFCKTAPLGHKIEAAKKVPAGSLRSKKLKAKADLELSNLAALLPLRADMVHSKMEIAVTTSSDLIAIFRNAKDGNKLRPEALVFSAEDLQRFVKNVRSLKKTIDTALSAQNPPTTPKKTDQVLAIPA